MDDIDRAQGADALFTRAAMAQRRPVLADTGKCHWCESPVPTGKFCDGDCRAAWEVQDRQRVAREGGR
jgi:hypothetical protein